MGKLKNGDLYEPFIKTYQTRFSTKQASVVQKDGQNLWNDIKEDREKIESTIRRLKAESGELKAKSTLEYSWTNAAKRQATLSSHALPEKEVSSNTIAHISLPESQLQISETEDMLVTTKRVSAQYLLKSETPKQDELKSKIREINDEIAFISKKSLPTQEEITRKKLLISESDKTNKQLNRLKSLQEAGKKFRDKQREILQKVSKENSESGAAVRKFLKDTPGRPPIEAEFPQLQQAIIDCVVQESSADANRRSDKLELCQTLDELVQRIDQRFGIQIKKTTLYHRLLPRRSNTIEGKRHINTVPVKLKRPENNLMNQHVDGHFASGTIKHLKEFASLLGDQSVLVISQDDKAKVPLGIPAANRQSRIVMHVDYMVKLPDHDFSIASRHKLTPSVYALCLIKDGLVSYSGPTYISIRSGKHDKSTAMSHLTDLNKLLILEGFECTKSPSEDKIKPIIIVFVDGGPDESPRYSKTMCAWVSFFKNNDIDFLAVATHAPGQSAYNVVERKMAPLSKQLAGLILPYDTYGSHLDGSRRTTNIDLEKANFKKAGESLADVWNEMIIDGFPVFAEYVDPEGTETQLFSYPNEIWIKDHVIQSQYCLQISKCSNRRCCSQLRTNYQLILPSRFIPPPLNFINTPNGFKLGSYDNGHFGSLCPRILLASLEPKFYGHRIPFDYHCPSIQNNLQKKFCKTCGQYFPTQVAFKNHQKAQICGKNLEFEEEIDDENLNEEEELGINHDDAFDLQEAIDQFPFFDQEDPDDYFSVFEVDETEFK